MVWFRLSNCFNARQSAENVVLWNEYSVTFPWEPSVVLLSDGGLVGDRRII